MREATSVDPKWLVEFAPGLYNILPPPPSLLTYLGQEEIGTSCEILYERMKSLGPVGLRADHPPCLLPVYSTLPSEMQTRIFQPAPQGKRKVVTATNIAETSLTVDGIYYVVDPGFVLKLKEWTGCSCGHSHISSRAF